MTYDGSVSALQVGLVVDVDDGWEQILVGETRETLFNYSFTKTVIALVGPDIGIRRPTACLLFDMVKITHIPLIASLVVTCIHRPLTIAICYKY